MKKTLAIISVFSATLLSGCIDALLEPKEDPTVFYLMSADANPPKRELAEQVNVNFMPISAPSYSARSQIISRSPDGTVEISEYSRWAELPNSGFVRVITDNISSASEKMSVFPYPAVAFDGNPLVLRVFINECIGELSKSLSFKGQYSLSVLGAQKSWIAREFAYEIPCGATYGDYVKSVDAALAKLSAEISAAIEKFSKLQKE